MIGKTISHFKITEELGRGGMGVVYKAEDTQLHCDRALKFLSGDTLGDADYHTRFIEEARSLASVQHPNICPVHEIGEVDGQIFIAMSYLEGQTLEGKLSEGPLPVEEVVLIARQVAAGLQKAHAQGILHRDIKPANIMITNDGPAVIMDFGLAKRSDAALKTRTGTLMGTLAYMAPEQLLSSKVDHRADLWAVGVLMYEMLTGKRPFRGDIDPAVIYAVTSSNPDPIGPQSKGAPAALEEIVERLLEKDPDRRFAHAGALLEALDDTGLVSSTGPLRTIRLQRWQRRRLGWTLAGVIPMVALVIVALFVWPGFLNPGPAISSLAVLPLVERAAGEDQTYFAEGITDELIKVLMKTGAGLTVVARSSAARANQQYDNIADTAKHLGVDAFIEGTVTRNGDQVRVSAQLVLAKTSEVLWADSYEYGLRNIFSLQREVAQAVATAINAELTPIGQEGPSIAHPVNPEAYELVLKGRYHRAKFTPESVTKSFELFQQAIDIDPTYADPYADLAVSHMIAINFGIGDINPFQRFQMAEAYLDSAINLGADLGAVHALLATKAMFFEWNWEKSSQEFQRAIELDPGNVMAWEEQAFLLSLLGRNDEAIASAQRAVQLDPLASMTRADLGYIYYLAGRFEEAEAAYEAVLELDPDFHLIPLLQGWLALDQGDFARAISLFPLDEQGEPGLEQGLVFAMAGQRSKAEEILKRQKQKPQETLDLMNLAKLHNALGQTEAAVNCIAVAQLQHGPYFPQNLMSRHLANLGDHPRVRTIIKQLGLPVY